MWIHANNLPSYILYLAALIGDLMLAVETLLKTETYLLSENCFEFF